MNIKLITLIGEIGSDEEEKSAEYLTNNVDSIAGKSAPEGKCMIHLGFIISGDFGTAKGKIKALKYARVYIVDTTWDIRQLIKEIL